MNQNKINSTIKYFLIFLLIFTFENLESKENPILAKVGNENIDYYSLQKALEKNISKASHNLEDMSKDSLINFINLYANYRLKVLDAIDRGYLQDTEVKNEIKQNTIMLAKSYLYDKRVLEPNINIYLDRRNKYIKIGVILFSFQQGVVTEESMKPRDLAQSVLDSILTGKINFEDAAKTHSSDTRTAESGGIIDSYILSTNIQRPLENAVFSLDAGEIYPEIVETSYGFFILKTVDYKERVLKKPAHILFDKKGGEITEELESRADFILNLLEEGKEFNKLAEEYSDDPASAINGGVIDDYYDLALGFENEGTRLDNNFTEALFSLKLGEYSGKVFTGFGIHIIKNVEEKKPDIEKEKEEVTNFYKRIHFENDKRSYKDKLSLEMGLKINDNILSKFLSKLDNSKTNLDSNWHYNVDNSLKRDILFYYKDRKWTIGELIDSMNNKSNPKFRSISLNYEGIKKVIDNLIEENLFLDVSDNLMKEYPDYKRLIKEFHDGILLFKVEASEVWDNMGFDSLEAKKYYDTTTKVFMTDEMWDISEIFVLSQNVADEVSERIANGEDFHDLAGKFTQRTKYREKNGNHGPLNSKNNRFSDFLSNEKIEEGAIIGPKNYQRGLSILKINEIIPSRKKSFEEAISDIAPILQEMKQKKLTEKWLSKVREKHKVEIFEKKIDEILNSKK